jgi:hypothetical protein
MDETTMDHPERPVTRPGRRRRPPKETRQKSPKYYFHSNSYYCSILLFVGGFSFGLWHGIVQQQQQQELQVQRPDCHPSHRDTGTHDRDMLGNHPRNEAKDDGWQIIHVYHGPPPDDRSFPSTAETMDPQQQHPPPATKWHSQAHQDEIIAGLFRNRTSGYYIDLAANDAIELSNTYALERYYHWTGLCIEPNPIYWYNLSYYRRRSHIVAAVVGNASHAHEEIYFRFPAGDHGGIANDGFNNGKRWQSESQKKFTVPLVDILQRFRAPPVIEYLSLDVEGAETYILQNFPWINRSRTDIGTDTGRHPTQPTAPPPPPTTITGSYHIKVMTAERLRGTIRQFIKDHHYRFIRKLTRWGESLWVHDQYCGDMDHNHSSTSDNRHTDILDWSVLNQYNFPL